MPAGEDRFSGRLLYPMYVLAVLPPRHRLSGRAVLEVADLADEPLLRLTPGFASHGWFEAACQIAHIRPRVVFESTAPQTLIALARAAHGIAVVPSPVRIPRTGVRVAVVVHRRVPVGRWAVAAWDPERFLRHMPCNSSKSWSTIARAAIPAANTFGALRRCPSQMLARTSAPG